MAKQVNREKIERRFLAAYAVIIIGKIRLWNKKNRVKAKLSKRRAYQHGYISCEEHLEESDTVRFSYDRYNMSPYDIGYLDRMRDKQPNPSKAQK